MKQNRTQSAVRTQTGRTEFQSNSTHGNKHLFNVEFLDVCVDVRYVSLRVRAPRVCAPCVCALAIMAAFKTECHSLHTGMWLCLGSLFCPIRNWRKRLRQGIEPNAQHGKKPKALCVCKSERDRKREIDCVFVYVVTSHEECISDTHSHGESWGFRERYRSIRSCHVSVAE